MSSQNNPLITIGITAFNAGDSLARAINGALAQDWPNKEIIIVDDASSDATPEIIETYKNIHSNIRCFRNETNKGVAATRNVILREAKGEYVAFFDDDDISRKDRLKKQYLRLQEFGANPFALCHSAREQVYPDGSKRLETTPGLDGAPPYGQAMFEKILLGKPVEQGFGSMATCSLMMPKVVFEKIGFYDEHFRRCEDTDFTLRFALEGGYFIGVADPLVTQTMTSSSEKTLLDEKKYHADIYRKYAQHLGKEKTEFGLQWLDLRYCFLQGDFFGFAKKFALIFLGHPVLSLRKLLWAVPNIGFNLSFKRFHRDPHG